MNDQDIFHHPDHPGLRFRVHIDQDDSGDAPWEREDGHGPVRDCYHPHGNPTKRAGERVLHSDRGTYWLYDWQAACKLAREDKWDAAPYDGHEGRIERAVQADFDRLRRWLNNDWYYVGVCVAVIDEDGKTLTDPYDHALWGIEADSKDYIAETALELAAEAGAEYAEVQQRMTTAKQEFADLTADAERWRKFCRLAQRKDLGTVFDEYGRPHSPTFRRWGIDCTDLTAETPSAALDSMKEPQA
jgi:hypothetical protein